MVTRNFGLLGGSGSGQGAKRVTRTGIALVHENEIVYPAAGSAAEAIQALGDARSTVQVFFPVQIEIRDAGAVPGSGNGMPGANDEQTLQTVERALRAD